MDKINKENDIITYKDFMLAYKDFETSIISELLQDKLWEDRSFWYRFLSDKNYPTIYKEQLFFKHATYTKEQLSSILESSIIRSINTIIVPYDSITIKNWAKAWISRENRVRYNTEQCLNLLCNKYKEDMYDQAIIWAITAAFDYINAIRWYNHHTHCCDKGITYMTDTLKACGIASMLAGGSISKVKEQGLQMSDIMRIMEYKE